MIDQRARVSTGVLLIALPLLFNVLFALLAATFDYPDVLRRPPEEILQRFNAGGSALILLWYAFALTPAFFLLVAVLLRHALSSDSVYLHLATPLAVAAALVQLLGLVRWPLLVPELAYIYLDPATDESTRAATLALFRAFHQYLGVAVGEHLGYLFTGAWTLVVGGAMLRTAPFRPWQGGMGLAAAVGILVGLLEPTGVAAAGTINALSYILWSIWLIAIGLTLLRASPGNQAAAAAVGR